MPNLNRTYEKENLNVVHGYCKAEGHVIYVVAGAVSDSSFSQTPPNGTLAYDSTNNFLYIRDGGSWLKAVFNAVSGTFAADGDITSTGSITAGTSLAATTSATVGTTLGIGGALTQTGANGQAIALKTLTELTTIAAAATTDTTIQMPAGAIVLAVSVRVTTVIPTATNFTVGDSGSAARFSTAAVLVAAGSTDKGTKAGAYYNASAASVRITPDGTPAANTGRVRVTIHYLEVTPSTS